MRLALQAPTRSFLMGGCFFLALFLVWWAPEPSNAIAKPHALNLFSQSLALVKPAPLLLPYHNGPLLSGPGTLNLYLIWYGKFTPAQRAIVLDFFRSFASPSASARNGSDVAHLLSSWWSTLTLYKDLKGASVLGSVALAGEALDEGLSLGKALKTADVERLVVGAISGGRFPADSKSVYMVLTARDVYVDGFCLDSCGFHAYTFPTAATQGRMLAYAWAGNAEAQCPGQCAWPFATPSFGPQGPPLRPPNNDTGVDGMLISVATVLAGAATNPFGTGYYQGDAAAPLEAVSACTGIFGKGAYPGYPGELLIHSPSGTSFNALGVNRRRFLLPAMWNPSSLNCRPL